jgi:site-specific recombinase XerD
MPNKAQELSELALRLGEATTHWLRHSCFSHLAQATGDLVMVRSLAGHTRLDTTSRYLYAEAEQMHSKVTQALETPASRSLLKHTFPANKS